MDSIIKSINKFRLQNLSKINDLQFTQPKYKFTPDILNFQESKQNMRIIDFLKSNLNILDKNAHYTKEIIKSPDIVIFDDVLNSLNINIINKKVLLIGEFNTDYNCYLNSECIDSKLNNISSIKQEFDVISIYDIFPIVNKLQSNLEQHRLKRNIEKLAGLKLLKNNGDLFFLLTHFNLQATRDVIIILTYLFENCKIIRPFFHNLNSTASYIYCNNFNKDRYSKIFHYLDITNFTNIDILAEIGVNGSNKEIVNNEIKSFASSLYKFIDLTHKTDLTNSSLELSKYLYSIGLPILPKFINPKLAKYDKLYEQLWKQNVSNIFINFDHPIKSLLEIYLHNKGYGKIYNKYEEYLDFDLIVASDKTELADAIYKLNKNGLLYIDQNNKDLTYFINNKVLNKIYSNIFIKNFNWLKLNKSIINYDKYDIVNYSNQKLNKDILNLLFPIEKNKYKVYSVKNGIISKTDFSIYPYFPIKINNVYFLNPIHIQMIDKDNISDSIRNNIKLLLTFDKDNEKQNTKIVDDFIHVKVNKDETPYLTTNNGWLSIGTKSNIYAISKICKPKVIVELGTWYGNSSEYFKKHNVNSACGVKGKSFAFSVNSRLLCFDLYRTVLESDSIIKGQNLDKFYFRYPRIESVFSRMSKYSNVELIKGNAFNSIKYLKENNIKPDLIFIDFIKSESRLYMFLLEIADIFPDVIIINDDYEFQSVKNAINRFNITMRKKYIIYENNSSAIMIPYMKDNKKIEEVMRNKIKKQQIKQSQDNYYKIYQKIKNDQISSAIKDITKYKLDLNKIKENLPNNGSLYHVFAYYLREHRDKTKYIKTLEKIEKPNKNRNNFDFTYEEILKYDTSRLWNST